MINYRIFFGFFLFFSPIWADSLEEYQRAKSELQAKNFKQYEAYLKKYPQSIGSTYLTYYYYQQVNLDPQHTEKALAFAQKNTQRAFYPRLLTRVIKSLAERRAWNQINQTLKNPNTLTLQCLKKQAQLALGQQEEALRDFEQLWTKNVLPTECASVENAFFAQQHTNTETIHQKIRQLLKNNDWKTAQKINQQYPNLRSKYHAYFIKLHANLDHLLKHFDPTMNVTVYPQAQEDYMILVERLGRKDSIAAQTIFDHLVSNQMIDPQHAYTTQTKLAIYQAGRPDHPNAIEKINAIPETHRSDELNQWGFRLAAKQGDWNLALQFLNALSASEKASATWTYWLGQTYEMLGQEKAARQQYEKISNLTEFYGFLASDKLDKDYHALKKLASEPAPKKQMLTNQTLRNAVNLFALREDTFARLEWVSALSEKDKKQLLAASQKAMELGKYDLALRSAVSARQPGTLNLRYLSVFMDEIKQYAAQYQLDPLMVLSLMRQESLFRSDVKSHADAYGLMQVLTETAQRMSKRLRENKMDSLTQPEANIRYGSTYLDTLTQELGHFWPYILAGYNAGPNRVKQWVNDPMDVVLWIESIPFKETRHYVKNVLENRVIYGVLHQEKDTKLNYYLQSFDSNESKNP